jgi:hypothetical protein
VESDVFTLLFRRLADRKMYIEQSLAGGAARDFTEYSRMVGEYAAFVEMENEIKDIEKRYLDG